jgi:hypothetical protein
MNKTCIYKNKRVSYLALFVFPENCRTNRFILLLLSLIMCLSACNSAKQTSASSPITTKTSTDYKTSGYVEATIVAYEVDGCKWVIQLGDGKKLVPASALKEAFASDGLKVWVKYETAKGGVGICMAGEMVKVTDLVKR